MFSTTTLCFSAETSPFAFPAAQCCLLNKLLTVTSYEHWMSFLKMIHFPAATSNGDAGSRHLWRMQGRGCPHTYIQGCLGGEGGPSQTLLGSPHARGATNAVRKTRKVFIAWDPRQLARGATSAVREPTSAVREPTNVGIVMNPSNAVLELTSVVRETTCTGAVWGNLHVLLGTHRHVSEAHTLSGNSWNLVSSNRGPILGRSFHSCSIFGEHTKSKHSLSRACSIRDQFRCLPCYIRVPPSFHFVVAPTEMQTIPVDNHASPHSLTCLFTYLLAHPPIHSLTHLLTHT